MKTGAFCLALGRFAKAEISHTLQRRETRSKIAAPVSLLSLTSQLVSARREAGTLGRTILPLKWFVPEADWTLVLARRWRWPLAIHVAEARATVIWMRLVVAARLDLGRLRALDVGDNAAAVSSFVKGRAHEWYLNSEMRRRASLEATSDLVLCSAWADARHQPADGGTRPDASGRLPLNRPLWVRANLVVEVFAGTARLTTAAREHPILQG